MRRPWGCPWDGKPYGNTACGALGAYLFCAPSHSLRNGIGKEVPIPPPRAPPPIVRSEHGAPRAHPRVRARFACTLVQRNASAVPAISAHSSEGVPTPPLALPLQPFEMRVDDSCVASAGAAPLLAPAAAQLRRLKLPARKCAAEQIWELCARGKAKPKPELLNRPNRPRGSAPLSKSGSCAPAARQSPNPNPKKTSARKDLPPCEGGAKGEYIDKSLMPDEDSRQHGTSPHEKGGARGVEEP